MFFYLKLIKTNFKYNLQIRVRMQKRVLVLVFMLVLVSASVSAHQPRLVTQSMTAVKNPEISQAFYGELKGHPDYFQIVSDKDFKLYVGILVPDLPNIQKDVSVNIITPNGTYVLLNGSSFKWTPFYEEFANDNYYQGPEFRMNATKGTYTIKVFSPDNKGKFSLAIGETESFPLNEIVNTIVVLPKIKQQIFEKPAYTAFFNKIGLFIFGPALVFVLVVVLVVWLIVKLLKKGKKKK